jgi:hypothetical protein
MDLRAGGFTMNVMIINFENWDGTIVIATPPETMSTDEANAAAERIYDKVEAARDGNYVVYADGQFNLREAILNELEAIGATVIADKGDYPF